MNLFSYASTNHEAGQPNETYPYGYPTISSQPTQPKININSGGVTYQTGQTTLDKILASVLSGFALYQNAGYVPTTTQPMQQPTVSPYAYGASYQPIPPYTTGTGNAIESFITGNTGLLLIVGLGLVLFMSGRK